MDKDTWAEKVTRWVRYLLNKTGEGYDFRQAVSDMLTEVGVEAYDLGYRKGYDAGFKDGGGVSGSRG